MNKEQIVRRLASDIPLAKRPYQEMAAIVEIGEHDVIRYLETAKREGYIRKFAAIVKHQLAGYKLNAMIVWSVPDDRSEAVGKLFASYPEVTHCYERKPPFEGKYNIFCMAHFAKRKPAELLKEMSGAASIQDYLVLYSEEEFKKSSMEYF